MVKYFIFISLCIFFTYRGIPYGIPLSRDYKIYSGELVQTGFIAIRGDLNFGITDS